MKLLFRFRATQPCTLKAALLVRSGLQLYWAPMDGNGVVGVIVGEDGLAWGRCEMKGGGRDGQLRPLEEHDGYDNLQFGRGQM